MISKIRRNAKPMSLDNLILEILNLEKDGIISFKEFKEIPDYEIKGNYFPMAHVTLIAKAKFKIEAVKSGHHGSISNIKITETYKNGVIKIERRTNFF